MPRLIQIDGHPPSVHGLHAALIAAATAHLEDVHRAKCTPETPLLFARMDCHGVGEDLNQAVRMFAVAVSQRRQLIMLPPPPEDMYHPKVCALPRSIELTARQPWHWLAGQNLPLSTILLKSTCQLELERQQPQVLEALAQSGSGNVTRVAVQMGATALAAVSREAQSLWRSHLAVSKHVPRVFQRMGLLWWFQILSTYLVRIRGPLAGMLQAHPAMRPFVFAPASAPGALPRRNATTIESMHWLGWSVRCGRQFCDGIGSGWAPAAHFDAGAHIRIGDSCRQKGVSNHYYTRVRRCDLNLSVVIRKLNAAGIQNGTLFVASDSQRVIDEAASGGAHPFVASYLMLNRSRFETASPTEQITSARIRLNSLLEALMDMVLLGRSAVIAGKMMSNFPRMAMQMRVQLPPKRGTPAYVTLDDRPWCSRTSCREGFLSPREQLAATRRELQRNPPV